MKNLRQNKGESLIMTLCFVLLLLVPSVISAQNSNITGRVVDTQGEPIIGATVMQEGTTNGVITNVDGEFVFSSSENDIKYFLGKGVDYKYDRLSNCDFESYPRTTFKCNNERNVL